MGLKKALLLCVTSQSVINFRSKLIEKLRTNGYLITVVTFDKEYFTEIEKLGVKVICIKNSNRSINAFDVLNLKSAYYKIIKSENPDMVFTFMLKPNTLGVLSAKKAGVKNIYSMVEGAGDVFINKGLKWRIIRKVVTFLYKKSFKCSKKVFFLNNDDKQEFLRLKLVGESQCVVISGIGVDVERFYFSEIKNKNKFLMIARMLKTKGVLEYCECARLIKKKYPNVEFNYLGAEETLKLTDIQEYIDDGSINYLGIVKDVRPYIEDSTAFVLPSYYREGLPMSIMEAESMGRPVITTNNVGCKDTVIDNYNGYVVDSKDVKALASACTKIIEDFDLAIEMGKNSRIFATENFDSNVINSKICEVLEIL